MTQKLSSINAEPLFKRYLDAFLGILPEYKPTYCLNQIVHAYLAFSCLNCSDDPNFVLCEQCFWRADHRYHIWYCKRNAFGYCDCGDEITIKQGCSCSEHSHQEKHLLSQQLFCYGVQMAKSLLEKIEKDLLAFDIPLNPLFLDILALCAIYGRTEHYVQQLYDVYCLKKEYLLISEDEARQSYFGYFITIRTPGSQQVYFYGSYLASNRYFRVHASYIVSHFSYSLFNKQNEGFYNTLIQILTEPSGIMLFEKTNFLIRLIDLVFEILKQQLAADKNKAVNEYVERLDIIQQFSLFRSNYTDYVLAHSPNMCFLKTLCALHRLLIDAYQVSTTYSYENSDVFSQSWFNFTNLYMLSIMKLSRYILALNMPYNLTFEEISSFENHFQRNYCVRDCQREYFAEYLKSPAENAADGYFPFICEYLNAFYLANLVYYSDLTMTYLFALWNFDFSIDYAVERLLSPILQFFFTRLRINAGDIFKQNILEFQAIVQQYEQLIFFNQIMAEQIFSIRVLLPNHSHPMRLIYSFCASNDLLLQFLHQLIFSPDYTSPTYFYQVFTTSGNYQHEDETVEAIISFTKLSELYILQLYESVSERHPIIMGDDKLLPKIEFYEHSLNLGMFDNILMDQIHNNINIFTSRRFLDGNKQILQILPAEFIVYLNAYLSDDLCYSLYFIIYRILKTVNFSDIKVTQFLYQQLTQGYASAVLSNHGDSLLARKSKLLERLHSSRTDYLLIQSVEQVTGTALKVCQICHQSEGKVEFSPVFCDSNIRYLSFCNHLFHQVCLGQLLVQGLAVCPLCEQPFNCIYSGLTSEYLELASVQRGALLYIYLTNHINRSDRMAYLRLLENAGASISDVVLDDFKAFFCKTTVPYIRMCSDPPACSVCQYYITGYKFQCPQCRSYLHGQCCAMRGVLVYCPCGHNGVFCIDRLQYLLSPFLIYPVPYKDHFGKITLYLFYYVKEMDYDSLEKLYLLVAQRQFIKTTKRSIEAYISAFTVQPDEISNYITEMIYLGALDFKELLEEEEAENRPDEV